MDKVGFSSTLTHCVGPCCSRSMPPTMTLVQKSVKLPSVRDSFSRSTATVGRVQSFFTENAAVFNSSDNLLRSICEIQQGLVLYQGAAVAQLVQRAAWQTEGCLLDPHLLIAKSSGFPARLLTQNAPDSGGYHAF